MCKIKRKNFKIEIEQFNYNETQKHKSDPNLKWKLKSNIMSYISKANPIHHDPEEREKPSFLQTNDVSPYLLSTKGKSYLATERRE